MKVIAYASRPDEMYAFNKISAELNIEIKFATGGLTIQTASEAEGFEFVTILGHCDASREVLEALSKLGVKFIASRSAGYNNIDLIAAKEFGIRCSNATYSPNCVADFASMLVLMGIRNAKQAILRSACNDFTVRGLQGKEMKNLTIGVIGTGRIGQTVIKNISGFGSQIIGYDLYPNEAIKEYMEYVELDTLFKTADVITLHAPYNKENHYLINKESLSKMKDGVVIVNTARGELIDTKALIEALESGKVGAAGLDVVEGEVGILHEDYRFSNYSNHNLSILKSMPNVTLTQHCAFYTDQAVYDMVECGLKSLADFNKGNKNPLEI